MLKRIRPIDILTRGAMPAAGEPYICDCRNIDISDTIAAMVRNAPQGLIAISLRPEGGGRMIAAAERAARRRGARIIWLPIGRAVA